MALYEIIQDCRIANVEYQKGDVVSDKEVGGFYPTVMKPTNVQPKPMMKEEVEEVEEMVEEKQEVKKPMKRVKRK